MAWRSQYLELKQRRQVKDAIALLQTEAEKGDLAARIELAIVGEEAGISRDEADRIIDEAAKVAANGDTEAHWGLYKAYELMLGSIPPETMAAASFRHLLKVAESSPNPAHAFALATRYATGDNAVTQDLSKAEAWFVAAAKLGSAEAVRQLQVVRRAKAQNA
jgi:TPR repeat protein